MVAIREIQYLDIDEAETKEKGRLESRRALLESIKKHHPNRFGSEKTEFERISAVLGIIRLKEGTLCEPLFVGVRDLFNRSQGLLGLALHDHKEGVLKDGAAAAAAKDSAFCLAALTIGLLMIDGVTGPSVVAVDGKSKQLIGGWTNNTTEEREDLLKTLTRVKADETAWGTLTKMFFAAFGEAQSMQDLAMLVLPLLALEGDPDGDVRGSARPKVKAAEFARVMRALAVAKVTTAEPQLRRRINEVLDRIQHRGGDISASPAIELGIDLPDLEDAAAADIVPDNVKLMGPMICAAMFDELKAFDVVDKLVELFQHGMLTIGNVEVGKRLYDYWKNAPNRMSAGERRNFYAMTMGIPGGETSGMVNRDFNDLWLRFVSSVSSFVRQGEVARLLRQNLPSSVTHQQVRKAARDLAANLSAHGYGMAFFASDDLKAQIRFMISVLGDQEIMRNYGAKDMWQVVDQVATLELGGAKTSSRYRTLASCGLIITAWLAKKAREIGRPGGPLIDLDEVQSPLARTDGSRATEDPYDSDLVNACELWLADTAVGDTVIEQMAQPRETPVMTSRPVQIPSIAREMLADLPGVGLGYTPTRH